MNDPASDPASNPPTSPPESASILLFQEQSRSALLETLEQDGFSVILVHTMTQLERHLEDQPSVSVLLCVLGPSEFEAMYRELKTKTWLEGHTLVAISGPAARMLGRGKDMQLPGNTRPHEILRFLKNLIDNPQTAPASPAPPKIRSSVRTQAAPELNGTLEFFSLFELLTLLGGSNKSGILHLHWNDLGASILVHDGQIRHAMWEKITGEAALSKIFLEAHAYPEGRFFFEDFLEGTPKAWQGVVSISAPTDKVLFQMAVLVAQQEG